ncbi:class I SAM-dependent methyltransferase [Paenibacillus pinihumi]|uniref:class I SAM-dependent methyltransferase n=1 Tax=Paenibacillus pinihumi TaxID=669462 RepID=UPI00048F80A4|nr:class I SAM-dependent methyltransferase [Paenibacillus pinihumi]
MNDVIRYYSGFDEWGRLEREPLEFLINWHYIRKHAPAGGKILDNGAGPGKYALELAKCGYQVTLTDLTPRLVGLAQEKAGELGLQEQFNGFHVLNAMNLTGIADDSYDGALMMGPLYHLQKEEERSKAVQELYRVTKRGGIVFVAVQTRMKMTLTSLQHPRHWKPHDTIASIRQFRENGVFNHQDEGRFTGAYFYDVNEITPFMEQHGFDTVTVIASSSLGGLLSSEQRQYWEEQGEGNQMTDLLIGMAEDPSILGIASHLLYIGRKK